MLHFWVLVHSFEVLRYMLQIYVFFRKSAERKIWENICILFKKKRSTEEEKRFQKNSFFFWFLAKIRATIGRTAEQEMAYFERGRVVNPLGYFRTVGRLRTSPDQEPHQRHDQRQMSRRDYFGKFYFIYLMIWSTPSRKRNYYNEFEWTCSWNSSKIMNPKLKWTLRITSTI